MRKNPLTTTKALLVADVNPVHFTNAEESTYNDKSIQSSWRKSVIRWKNKQFNAWNARSVAYLRNSRWMSISKTFSFLVSRNTFYEKAGNYVPCLGFHAFLVAPPKIILTWVKYEHTTVSLITVSNKHARKRTNKQAKKNIFRYGSTLTMKLFDCVFLFAKLVKKLHLPVYPTTWLFVSVQSSEFPQLK